VVAPELIKAAQTGDREAIVALLREIESPVYRTAFYMLGNIQDALDASQETLIRVYTKISTYEDKALFMTWVQRIVTNVCIDKFRKTKPTVSTDEDGFDHKSPNSVEDEVISNQSVKDIKAAIQMLPEQHRTVIVLRYLEQFSYQEIAESLDLPINTVKSYLFRGRKQLQTLLQKYRKGDVQE